MSSLESGLFYVMTLNVNTLSPIHEKKERFDETPINSNVRVRVPKCVGG